ncbi:hypothetical protein CHH28_08395 [Bacterioplanes sanyensis]|uniref:HTH tetR-type domain-containing protein n=1 Tax=Bacterioplanes sanyensis TaxID=1249553 RepID=A0A222FI85_9GAMM|nr:TetR/AcrR family transcriptional regulator [Bacterioplanes sanyensis]ASP38698.1 hypothetical protein CHH28_08395 [Bacterioplanes sanyensis]
MSRGRPQDPLKQQQTMSALLDAARELLQQQSYKSITIRQLAQQAGTQTAMISYYFGSKQGLFEQLMVRTTEQRQRKLMALAQELQMRPEGPIELMVNRILDIVLSEPWLFRYFQSEMFSDQPNTELSELPQKIRAGIVALFRLLQQQGVLRAEFDCEKVAATFMSLLAFPLLSQPMFHTVFGLGLDELNSDAWRAHLCQLLQHGLVENAQSKEGAQ